MEYSRKKYSFSEYRSSKLSRCLTDGNWYKILRGCLRFTDRRLLRLFCGIIRQRPGVMHICAVWWMHLSDRPRWVCVVDSCRSLVAQVMCLIMRSFVLDFPLLTCTESFVYCTSTRSGAEAHHHISTKSQKRYEKYSEKKLYWRLLLGSLLAFERN